MKNVISKKSIEKRTFWIEKIRKMSGRFYDNSEKIENELENDIKKNGTTSLIDNLRLCGNIPESYQHDSTEEKLYSKYTDCLLSQTFKSLGLKSLVLSERADSADVEVFANDYSFVADAKVFRLSRTAKNQKDFKVQAMDNWKKGKLYAMIVCPIYQLPNRASQIYQQATSRNVCIFTYSHLSLVLSYALLDGQKKAQELLHKIFKLVSAINPSKDAIDYWIAINSNILRFSNKIEKLWNVEKEVSIQSMNVAKELDLIYLAKEREKIMRMSHDEALKELIKVHKIDSKIETIKRVSDNGLFTIK